MRQPLTAKRKPGPAAEDARPTADALIGEAAKVLALVESGQLSAQGLPPPISIPVNRQGKPLKPLTVEQERELAVRIQGWGCVEARRMFVLANMGLVHMVARQQRHTGILYEDLTQEGVLGLIRATETFDPAKGVRFSTYCVHWIRAKIGRFAQHLERDDAPRLTEAPMEVTADGRRMRPRMKAVSLQAEAGNIHVNGDDKLSIEERVADDRIEGQQGLLERHQRRDLFLRVFDEIRAETKDRRIDVVIRHRLLAEEPESLDKIGQRMALSCEGARLLEIKVLEMAREKMDWELDGDKI